MRSVKKVKSSRAIGGVKPKVCLNGTSAHTHTHINSKFERYKTEIQSNGILSIILDFMFLLRSFSQTGSFV